jgi:hypothetical protein
MQDRRGVLELAVFADGSSFAVAVRLGAIDAERSDRTLGKQIAEFLTDLDQR